jgi:23S rRNA (pseudouridine1915-N3)-methyltransferase
MKIRIVAIGKLKEKYLKDAISEYSKRLSRFVQLEIIELPYEKAPEKISLQEQQIVLKKEADKMLAKIPSTSTLILMDVQGKAMTSENFSKTIENYMVSGKSSFCIVIGGSLGIHDSLKQRADLLLSMSKMTFPHQLARVILLEQLYRAFKIMKNETYHK